MPRPYDRLLCSRRAQADERVDTALEHVQRQRSRQQHVVVKVLDVESIAKRGARLLAELDQLELSDHIRGRLAGIHDVSLDLAGLDAVVDGLLARPPEGMEARVDDQPARAEQLRVE